MTRAVYFDITISLSVNDFLLVSRQFISVYRKPGQLISDNATNLVGVERLLREVLVWPKGGNPLTIAMKALGVEWLFQPTQTPRFCGSHESLGRSIKKVLRGLG